MKQIIVFSIHVINLWISKLKLVKLISAIDRVLVVPPPYFTVVRASHFCSPTTPVELVAPRTSQRPDLQLAFSYFPLKYARVTLAVSLILNLFQQQKKKIWYWIGKEWVPESLCTCRHFFYYISWFQFYLFEMEIVKLKSSYFVMINQFAVM